MRPFTIIIELSDELRAGLKDAVNSPETFTRQRAQILLLSAQGICPREIAEGLGCSQQTVRNAINELVTEGIGSLTREKMGPKNPTRTFDEPTCERLMTIAHQSPRAFGKPQSQWTLKLLAEVCFEQKLTDTQVSIETIRKAIIALGSSWQRAKNWIVSPDPQYLLKKSSVTA
jgi:transposase